MRISHLARERVGHDRRWRAVARLLHRLYHWVRSRLREWALPDTEKMTQLKLIAFDQDDLNVVSAHLQDAIVRVGDMALLPREKRFAAILSRFDWTRAFSEPAASGKAQGELARLRTALRFERVLSARLTGIDLQRPDDILVLLALSYEPHAEADPSGTVTLTFAGRAALKLEVECVEAELKDLGPGWATRSRPVHPLDEDSDRSEPG